MSLVMQCFEVMAARYPRDFLHLLTHMPLEPEPEVLEMDCNDVMLPQMLIVGSQSRCPRGVWEPKIAQYRVAKQTTELAMEAGEASTQGISKRSMTSMLGVPLRRKTSFQGPEGFGGLDDATRKKLAEEAGRGSRVWKRLDAPPHYAADADKRKMPVRVPGKGRRPSVAACLSKAKEAMMGKDDKDKPAESSAESIPEGFCKRSRGGLKAMRVPFDNFGGYVVNNSGNKVQPLHLIIEVRLSQAIPVHLFC
jgi:hypothetical protein